MQNLLLTPAAKPKNKDTYYDSLVCLHELSYYLQNIPLMCILGGEFVIQFVKTFPLVDNSLSKIIYLKVCYEWYMVIVHTEQCVINRVNKNNLDHNIARNVIGTFLTPQVLRANTDIFYFQNNFVDKDKR